MDPLQHNILSCLAYFDIFDYPLKKEEIQNFLGQKTTSKELAGALALLVQEGWIKYRDNFYFLGEDASLIARRQKGNERAISQLAIAGKSGAFLSGFPYVRAIGISGSLSKNFADEKSDIDFFIITAKNRLWLARTCMHIFRKFTFLAGKHNWFCMNYYVDEDALEIKEKNNFTAMELITVLPVRGKKYFDSFFRANEWAKHFFPMYESQQFEIREAKNNLLKKLVEKVFNNRLGDKLDNWLMKKTHERWQKKTNRKQRNSQGTLLGMDVNKHYAKPSPDHLQSQILRLHQKKMKELTEKFEMHLSRVI